MSGQIRPPKLGEDENVYIRSSMEEEEEEEEEEDKLFLKRT